MTHPEHAVQGPCAEGAATRDVTPNGPVADCFFATYIGRRLQRIRAGPDRSGPIARTRLSEPRSTPSAVALTLFPPTFPHDPIKASGHERSKK
jgi:hypothetical protein